MHGRRRMLIPVLVIAIAAGAVYWYSNQASASGVGPLTASGTIEATTVTVGPDIAGRVKEVLVDEGDAVAQGDVLVRLDSTVLDAQRTQAATAIDIANAGVAASDAAVRNAQAGVTAADAAVDSARAALDAARSGVDAASSNTSLLRSGPTGAQLSVARRQVEQARTAWRVARRAYAKLSDPERLLPTGVQLKLTRDNARAALATAEAQYRVVASGSRPQQVSSARAQVRAARAQVDAAKVGVETAEARAEAARAQQSLAEAQGDGARGQLASAQAGLAVVDAQLGRLTLTAPADGTVLSRLVEPGEIVSPGAALLELGDLGRLTLTVFVPEDRYGAVTLGEAVDIRVDAFAGQGFAGKVRRISDQAEFTPRNVQTVEGRKSTVFAIELALDPTDGRLKPGMPADVTFR